MEHIFHTVQMYFTWHSDPTESHRADTIIISSSISIIIITTSTVTQIKQSRDADSTGKV